MEKEYKTKINDIGCFKNKVLDWSKSNDYVFFLDSSAHIFPNRDYNDYDLVAGFGCIHSIIPNSNTVFTNPQSLNIDKGLWYFSLISYDLKNQIENLRSENPDYLNWPQISLIAPELIILLEKDHLRIISQAEHGLAPAKVFNEIESRRPMNSTNAEIENITIKSRMSKEEYLSSAIQLLKHIKRGDIYEINFCQEFYATEKVKPLHLFLKLNKLSPTPFSAYLKYKDKYLICASPERYIKRKGNKIISQPIKGTIKRGRNDHEDNKLIEKLKNDQKEISENVMIVDLVRNDLSRIANRNSVKVEELCGIYPFAQVHQMISTISATIENLSLIQILKATFPMGSMTGAPKIRAMELAEKYETSKRGLYSGAVGYINPKGDFDFNVVIRSLQYNENLPYLSYMVGSALTIKSDPEYEYNECLLKASAIEKVLGKNTIHA